MTAMNDLNAIGTIKTIRSDINKSIAAPNNFNSLKSLLVEKAKALRAGTSPDANEVYLLSFHNDGVVWGKLNEKDVLKTSDGVVKQISEDKTKSPSPSFRIETLQECRLFSKRGELLIWRASETEFKARLILDDENKPDGETECFDEPQVLWGRDIDEEFAAASPDFTVVREGQGVRHAVPLPRHKLKFGNDADETKRPRPLRLWVRHYLAEDEDGCVRIALSRLRGIEVKADSEVKAGK